MLLPNTETLTCFIGGTWDQEFDFWDDTAETIPHDFTGWTVVFIVTHYDGTTTAADVQVTGNAVVASLTALQTSAFVEEEARWALSMHDTSNPENVEFLMRGPFKITNA